MSKSVDNANYLENVKNLKRSVVTSKLNIILSKHQDKNVKNIRKSLKNFLAENDMNKRRLIKHDQRFFYFLI